MAIFRPKRWVNPFGKMSILPLFELLVFKASKGGISFQNIVKDIFMGYIASKKKLEKWPFLDLNHGLTPLEKCQFFGFLNFLFLQPQKAVFRSRISEKTFSWPILPTKKVGKTAIFEPKPCVNPFGKIFRVFELLVFIALKGVFTFQNFVKDVLLAYIA